MGVEPYEFQPAGSVNLPPNMNVEKNATIYLSANSFLLIGTAGGPEGALLVLSWMHVGCPANSVLVSRSVTVTCMIFSTSLGTYTFRFTASEKMNSASEDAKVTLVVPAAALVAAFEAKSGTVPPPVTISVTVSQSMETNLIGSGRVAYASTVSNQGDYTIVAWVSAPTLSENSFFVRVDGDSSDLYLVWDVLPLTSGVEARIVSWLGSGTFANNEFNPKVFNLAAGTHSLVEAGREAGGFEVRPCVKLSSPPRQPLNLCVVP